MVIWWEDSLSHQLVASMFMEGDRKLRIAKAFSLIVLSMPLSARLAFGRAFGFPLSVHSFSATQSVVSFRLRLRFSVFGSCTTLLNSGTHDIFIEVSEFQNFI